jgi:hypothetical protein
MRTRIVTLVIGLALAAASPVAAHEVRSAPAAAHVAKSCSSGYTHAVIGGSQKCLHAGEFCAKRYRKQYRRYGYRCVRVGDYYRLR